ncbi:sugar transferase [Candidatus Parcubacteria bacterium]|nr:sugar transferase [Candidatus Parcubacteria bacterium]
MNAFRSRTLVLFVGDLVFFVFALWLSLYLRVMEAPSQEFFLAHLAPFSFLFLVWVAVFFIAGLYESRSIILARRAFSATLLVAQTLNLIITALFFFFVPWFGIAPKTLLFIYLPVSFLLILLWRVVIYPWLGLQRSETAIMVGQGKEIDELTSALNRAHRAPARIVEVIRPSQGNLAGVVEAAIHKHDARFVIADFSDKTISAAFPELYNYLAKGIRFFDALPLYEEVFGRIALSHIDDQWLARNVSRSAHLLYDSFKRAMDIVIGLPAALVFLVIYPCVALALKIQDSGEVVIAMPRVGEAGRVFNFYKFRSMSGNDNAEYGSQGTSKLYVTKVGKVLRVTRLDELPQLWNVIKGDLSLIGPRPEAPSLVSHYVKEIPYYNMRHLVKPGLSGWAQLYHDNHPHHGTEVEATREKFSYDLYYLKHRSLLLDAVIILKTIKKMLLQSGK